MSSDVQSMVVNPEDRYFAVDDEIATYERAQIVVIQAGYERTVSYGGGTAAGPEAIRTASQQVEFYDEELDREPVAERGVCTLRPLDCDCDGEEINKRIYQVARPVVEAGKVPALIGGEHTVSYGNVRACSDAFGDSLSILHIDAHSDLRDTYMGQKYNHATAAARFVEFGPIVQCGIRSRECSPEVEATGLAHPVYTYHAFEHHRVGPWIEEAVSHLSEHVYLTVDVDGFDPSVFPGTGTPEPGGLDWWTGLTLIRSGLRGHKLVGFDIVEVAPIAGTQQTEFAAARLMSKIIGYSL